MNASASCLVVNTSPLIHLAEADLLHLSKGAAAIIWIPDAVAWEIQAYGPQDATARALAANDWLEVRPAPPLTAQVLAWDPGPGESAVIEPARSSADRAAVIDDLAGRRCAEALGLALRGTVRLVLAAKKADRLPAARPVLERLRDSGMYLSDAVLQGALKRVGE